MSKWKPDLTPYFKFKTDRNKTNSLVGKFIFEAGETKLLRQVSKPIPIKNFNTSETKAKFKYLKDCLLTYRKITGYGRGITAVQVGIPLCFSAIYKGQTIQNIKNKKNVSYDDVLIIANPKVTGFSEKLLKYPEMCMSLSPVIVPVIRPSWIEFSYLDEKGNKNIWDEKDSDPVDLMMNRVLIHELDHMEGIVNIDRVKNPKEIILHSDPDFYSSAKFEKVK